MACRLPHLFLLAAIVFTLLPAVDPSPEPVGFFVSSARGEIKRGSVDPRPPGFGVSGNYLSGRHAKIHMDFDRAAMFFSKIQIKDPSNTDILRQVAIAQSAAGNLEAAARVARELTRDRVISTIPQLILFADAIRENNEDEASRLLTQLPESNLSGVGISLFKAWLFSNAGNYDEAVKALDSIASFQGFQPMRLHHLALVQEYFGKFSESESTYRRALEISKSVRTIQAFGYFLERLGRSGEAIALYKKYSADQTGPYQIREEIVRLNSGKVAKPMVIEGNHGVAEALFNLAGILVQNQTSDFALILCRLAVWIKPDFPAAKMLIGDLFQILERPKEALSVFSSFEESSPLFWSARLRQALLLSSLKQQDKAEKLLRKMSLERQGDVDALSQLGDMLREAKKFDSASAVYSQAISRIGAPDRISWSLFYSRGISYERSKKWDLAEKDFLEALKINPKQPYVLNYLGYSWVDQGRNLEKAKKMIEEAVRLRPNDGYIVDSLGWVLFRLQEFEAATNYLEKAVSLRPADPTINDHLGDAYWRVGRLREARFQWRRSLSFSPEPDQEKLIKNKLLQGLQRLDGQKGKG